MGAVSQGANISRQFAGFKPRGALAGPAENEMDVHCGVLAQLFEQPDAVNRTARARDADDNFQIPLLKNPLFQNQNSFASDAHCPASQVPV